MLYLTCETNKQIMALAVARWDANTCAASPLSHTCLRPIFGSYVTDFYKFEGLNLWITI